MTSKSETTPDDELMDEATEITKEIQELDFDGLFPFQAVRLLIWEGLRKCQKQ